MDKQMYFISGMPRAGSTLLANILAQNPDIHSTPTSGLLQVLFDIRNRWDVIAEHTAQNKEISQMAKMLVMKSVLGSYHVTDRPIIMDKSRGWLAHIEMLEAICGEPKILVPVRDLRDILASFEMLWRKQSATSQWPVEKENYAKMQSLGGRLDLWMKEEQPIGQAYRRVRDAMDIRGHRKKLHLVRFEDLTAQPEATLAGIYAFLGLEQFSHDFSNIEQYTQEDDQVYGMGTLHEIRPAVEPIPPRWPSVLGDIANKYKVVW